MDNNILIFASNNRHKAEEILAVTGDQYKIITLKEAGIDIDIPEPYNTIEANASGKSKMIYQLTQQNCFGDDTGLEVEALNGEPGVKSARYAGDQKDFDANIDKLLSKLDDKENRNAQFRTVISLMWNDKEYLFEGMVKGMIIYERRGANGFGYDPVFIPEGSYKTFGEMTLEEKNLFSHRKKAVDKLMEFLKQQ
ncbi:RdgB/HAM1 family non-canonical purine NTP pyrophosphatase [Parafilimonas sp.]|uniref:RdgB/HAM1 family non-canonical purine NTP pyrophosphatase n=1 Tax=Parafilimonas sp. TaxID=1969739 RepID=UPI0039E5836C